MLLIVNYWLEYGLVRVVTFTICESAINLKRGNLTRVAYKVHKNSSNNRYIIVRYIQYCVINTIHTIQ